MNIIEALHSEDVFLPLFKDVKTWHSWEVYLKALFGLPIEGIDDDYLFHQCTGLTSAPTERQKSSFVICGRRAGKSYVSSIIAVFMATFKDWRKFLSPGERGWIFIIANDKNQARIIKNYVSGILSSNQSFKRLVEKDLTWEVVLKNQVTIAVKTSSFRTIRGYTILCAILEEISFYRSEESANPDKEILAAIRPALATIPDSLLIGISTPYRKSGVLFEMFKRYYGKAKGPLIWKAPTLTMNPTIDEEIVKEALEDDPSSASAEWLSEFRADIEAFMPEEFVESAVIPGRFELPRIEEAEYFGACDPSGGRQDSMTLAISHKDKDGRVVLDVSRESRPPFQPKVVVKEFSTTLKAYGISEIESDRYGAEWITSAFRDNDITVKNSELSASEIYLSFLPLMANGTIELLDNKRLKSQLVGLERKVRPGGKDMITHYPGGHDDVANSAAMACVMANKEESGGAVGIADVGIRDIWGL